MNIVISKFKSRGELIMESKNMYFIMFFLLLILLSGCSQVDRENYLDNNRDLVTRELGEWELIEKEKIQNGFESIYYNCFKLYKP